MELREHTSLVLAKPWRHMAVGAKSWAALAAVSTVLCCNHWVRDWPGALQIPLEEKVFTSTEQYHSFNSIYFLPNLITPVVGGALATKYGAPLVWGSFSGCLALGCLLQLRYALVEGTSIEMLFAGRILNGVAYEALDMIAIGVVQPLFGDLWTIVAGIYVGVIRMGSVAAFLVEPYLYERGGITPAIIAPCIAGITTVPMALFVYWACKAVAEEKKKGGVAATKPRLAVNTWYWIQMVLFVLAGGALYGAMVPFWFIGSKVVTQKTGISLMKADQLLLIPEATIAFVSPATGFVMQAINASGKCRYYSSGISLIGICVGLSALAYLEVTPGLALLCILVASISYAVPMAIIWSCVTFVANDEHLNNLSGCIGSFMNVLPAVILYTLTDDSTHDLTELVVVGFCGVICYVILGACHREQPAESAMW